jgi:hypothetical protein
MCFCPKDEWFMVTSPETSEVWLECQCGENMTGYSEFVGRVV